MRTPMMASGMLPRDRPDIRTQLTGSFTNVDQRLNAIALATRLRISSLDAWIHHLAAIAPRPRRAIRGLQGAAQGYRQRLRRRSRWLLDTVGLPIGAVDRNGGLTRCRRWWTCWTGFRRGATTCSSSFWQTARQRGKRSTSYWSCAVMLKISRRSSCQKASDGTDGAHRWR